MNIVLMQKYNGQLIYIYIYNCWLSTETLFLGHLDVKLLDKKFELLNFEF